MSLQSKTTPPPRPAPAFAATAVVGRRGRKPSRAGRPLTKTHKQVEDLWAPGRPRRAGAGRPGPEAEGRRRGGRGAGRPPLGGAGGGWAAGSSGQSRLLLSEQASKAKGRHGNRCTRQRSACASPPLSTTSTRATMATPATGRGKLDEGPGCHPGGWRQALNTQARCDHDRGARDQGWQPAGPMALPW